MPQKRDYCFKKICYWFLLKTLIFLYKTHIWENSFSGVIAEVWSDISPNGINWSHGLSVFGKTIRKGKHLI